MSLRLTQFGIFCLMVLIGGLFPFPFAWAQNAAPSNLYDQSVVMATQIGIVPRLISVVCYALGVFFSVRALLALKNYISDPDENPVNTVLSFGGIGALLIMLPYSIAIVYGTIQAQNPTVESSQLTFEDPDEAYYQTDGDKDLGDMFQNLSGEFIPLARTMAIFAYVMAAVITLVGLVHLKNYGDDPSQVPVRSIIAKFVLATCLISLPFAMQVFITTVTGRASIEDQETVTRPCMIQGSGLAQLRGDGDNVACQ